VYFVDAAHFVLGAFLAILWSFRRIFVYGAPLGFVSFNHAAFLSGLERV